MSGAPSEYTPTGNDQGRFSPADILFKYLAYLPLFVLCLVLCVTGGILYLRYTTPKFVSNVQVMVKSGKDQQSLTGSRSGLVELALYGPEQINMTNEIERIKSISVLQRAVEKNLFHINYFMEGNLKTSNVFNAVPFRLIPVAIVDSSRPFKIRFTELTAEGYTLLVGTEGREKHRWTDIQVQNGNQFRLQPIAPINKDENIFIATWIHPAVRAQEILNELTIYNVPNTTILSLSFKNDNGSLGRAILNSLAIEFNRAGIEAKNEVIQNTVRFIQERLDSLQLELQALELQQKLGSDRDEVLTPEQQASLFMSRLSSTDNEVSELELQLGLIDMVEKYVSQKATRDKLVPSSLGISNETVNGMIGAYNAMQQQREKDAPNLPESGLLMNQLNTQMEEIRQSILISLRNYRAALQQNKSDILAKNNRYRSELAQMPEKLRRQLELERQQKVKENLYLYLLQQKEETAIATASTQGAYEQLNPANGGEKPVEPDAGKIRTFSILLGLLLPIGIIYARDQLNDRLYTRDDIQKKTRVSIIGEIGHVEDNRSLVVAHQSRNIISEQFRIVRSNLNFFMRNKPVQTILVTSTVSGEGKSFISINMAAVLALSGKKVALLEFDLRKPRILTNLAIEKTGLGISNYLLGMAEAEEIYTPLENFPNLHIYPSGIVPPNPAELIMSENNLRFFDYLKENYDHIIIDSAPVGLVSDTLSLAQFIDVSLYIVRHRFTYKRQLAFVEEISQQQKLPNLYIVVNDLKMGARFGYYGYGGYGKGYGYGYGYYYGYGGKVGAEEYYDVQATGWRKWYNKLFGKKG